MKVFIKNIRELWREDSEVRNEKNELIFLVEGKTFAFGKTKRIYGMDGTHLFTVYNRFFNLFSNKVYVTDAHGKRLATVKKERLDISGMYQILDTEEKMAIDGNLLGSKYFITKNGLDVAGITKEFTAFVDSYVLDADEKDIAFFTALVIALDNLKDKRSRKA